MGTSSGHGQGGQTQPDNSIINLVLFGNFCVTILNTGITQLAAHLADSSCWPCTTILSSASVRAGVAAVVQLEGLTDGTMTESTMIYLPSLQLPLLSAQ